MDGNSRGRAALLAPVLLSGLLAAGCMGSPTYGTAKSANAQLTSDLTSMFSMRTQRGSAPDYRPRPELVKPATMTELPPPQESVTTANPAWPESPEQKRARILAEIDGQDGSGAEPLVINDMAVAKSGRGSFETPSAKQDREASPMSNREAKAQRERFNNACRDQHQPHLPQISERAAARIPCAGLDGGRRGCRRRRSEEGTAAEAAGAKGRWLARLRPLALGRPRRKANADLGKGCSDST